MAIKMNRQQRRASLKHYSQKIAAGLSGRLSNGERRKLSPIAEKVIARLIGKLLAARCNPVVMQISEREALAIQTFDATPGGQYAIAAAFNSERMPYCTPPICAFPTGDPAAPTPTSQELAEIAEQQAFAALFAFGDTHNPQLMI